MSEPMTTPWCLKCKRPRCDCQCESPVSAPTEAELVEWLDGEPQTEQQLHDWIEEAGVAVAAHVLFLWDERLRRCIAALRQVRGLGTTLCKELQCSAMEYLSPEVQKAWSDLFNVLEVCPI